MSAQVNSGFWLGKRVLLTGHTGFKGSWLSLWLQSMGVELCGLALDPPSSPSLFTQADVALGMRSLIIDIRDYESVLAAVVKFKPEIVIHMAAQSLVRTSYQDPIGNYATNVMGTVHLLEAVRQVNTVKVVLNVTSDKCYENKEWHWGYREEEAMGGHDPYSSSKACAELVSSSFRRSFFKNTGLALATARAGNVIGGGDWALDRLVPDILRAFEENVSAIIRNPQSIRPWQHVLEPLSGYLILAESLYINGQLDAEAWNFGPSDEDAKPVKWIVDKMALLWQRGGSWKVDTDDHPHEAHYLKLDTSKSKNRLGWYPRWDLNKTLENIVFWHSSWLNKEKAKSLCLTQINQYKSFK